MIPTSKDFKLARVFLNHSLKVKSKEKVLITCSDSAAFPLLKAIYIETLKLGAFPLLDIAGIDFEIGRSHLGGLAYQFFKRANQWQLNHLPKEIIKAKIDWADAYVRIVSLDNVAEFAQIPPEKMTLRQKLIRPYFDKMIDSDRWVLTYFPTPAMAQQARVAFDWLVDFYYKACLVDYQAMKRKLKRLEKILDKGEIIHLTGKNTDLTFSIKDRLAKACFGERNIPDGEVFLCPVEETIEGKVYFDLPTTAFGREVQGIYLEFKKGKVIKAKAEIGQEVLEKMLATDDGAKHVGEFAIGTNPNIKQAMKNTLFDEKIAGTIHIALGRAYSEKRGGGKNKSAIHWDLVKDMRIKGSRILIDGKKVKIN